MSVSDKEDPDFEQHLTPAFEGTETKRDYPLGIFVADREVGSPSVQVILIAVFEGKNLVAFPHGAWNRTVAKRTLPPQSVVKPTLVEVLAVSAEDRTELQEDTFLKVWIGFLKPEFMMNVQLATDVSEGELIFGEAEGAPLLPSADALVAVAQEHFAFFSAEETGPGTRYPAHPRSSGSGAPDLETRMTRMEDTMIEINRTLQNLSPLIGKTTPPVLQPSSKKSSVPSKAGLGKERAKGQDYPGLDSAVVTAALQAGVPETSLREMQKLIGGNPKAQKLGDLTSHAKRADPLSEDDEDEPDVVVPQEAGECGSAKLSPIEQNLTHLTSIVEMLSEERKRVMGRNKLEAALDHAGPVSLEGSGMSGGKRNAAARRALRSTFSENPSEIYQLIKKLMYEDLHSQTLPPGMKAHSMSARSWVEFRSRIGNYKSTAYAAWSTAGILDSLMVGDVAKARARASLLLLMLDQASVDRGNWTLAAELGLEQGPPFSTLATHQGPSIADGEQPFSRLLDPRWAEISLSHLKDTDDYLQKRSSVGKMQKGKDSADGGSNMESDSRRKPKAKAKNRAASASSNQQSQMGQEN